ncbi:hypothetical protein [Streptomyces sp. NPDC052225]|uniref:hypothetical protein n=1 Tax=Streptomyces sp. NPDC052225 TaxID=3154949 RepID=UPI0034322E4C
MRKTLSIVVTSLVAAAVLPVALSGQAAADTPWPSPNDQSVSASATPLDTPWPGPGTGSTTAAADDDTPWPLG